MASFVFWSKAQFTVRPYHVFAECYADDNRQRDDVISCARECRLVPIQAALYVIKILGDVPDVLCALYGEVTSLVHHGGTENTGVAQRKALLDTE